MSEFRFPPFTTGGNSEVSTQRISRTAGLRQSTMELQFLPAHPSSVGAHAANRDFWMKAPKSFPGASQIIGVNPDTQKIILFDIAKYRSNLESFLTKYTSSWTYGITWQNIHLVAQNSQGWLRYPWDMEPGTSIPNGYLNTSRRVDIGSACKPITAVAMFRLLRSRGLSIYSLIGEFLTIPASWGLQPISSNLKNKATFAHLLGHKSGLNDAQTNGDYKKIGDSGWYGTLPFSSGFGKFTYANANYFLCRMLAWRLMDREYPPDFLTFEIESSAAFASYIRNQILGPIGIQDVFWGPSGKMEHAPLAYDFPWVLGKPGYHVNSTDSYERHVGPGGLFLSMDKLLHFHRMLYSTTELLPHPDVAHMLSGYNDTGNRYRIGMDFSTFKYANTGRHFGHGGDVDVPQLYGAGLANKDRYWMRTKLVSVPLLAST